MTIEELKQALEAATPREWEIKRSDNGEVIGVVDGSGREVMSPDHDHWAGWKVSFHNPSDARLIVEAVNNLPALLKVVEAAEKALAYPAEDEMRMRAQQPLRKALEELNNG